MAPRAHLAVVTFLLATGMAQAAGVLDGKVYIVQVTIGDQAAEEHLLFAAGGFDALADHGLGFGSSIYTSVSAGGAVGFTAETESAKEGSRLWKGTVEGESLSGVMKWWRPGAKVIESSYTGKLAPPLFQRLGGAEAVATLAGNLVQRLAKHARKASPEVAAEVVAGVTAWLTRLGGGPDAGGAGTLREAAAALRLSDKDLAGAAAALADVLDSSQVAKLDAQEVLALLAREPAPAP